MRLPRELETERLRLRTPRPDDQGFLEGLFSDPGVVRFLSLEPVTEPERIRAMLSAFTAAWARHGGDLSVEKQGFLYLLERRSDRAPLGTLGVRKETYGYELSYALARSAWGHGYMPEAVRAVADWLLAHGAWRVFATCHVDNTGSQRVLEKAGFEREGRMRRYFTFPNLGPEPADGYLYAKVTPARRSP